MKYIVVCYAVHEQGIGSCDPFDKEEMACDFLRKDAQNTYEEEKTSGENANLTFEHERRAVLSSCDGEYVWTWEIISVE